MPANIDAAIRARLNVTSESVGWANDANASLEKFLRSNTTDNPQCLQFYSSHSALPDVADYPPGWTAAVAAGSGDAFTMSMFAVTNENPKRWRCIGGRSEELYSQTFNFTVVSRYMDTTFRRDAIELYGALDLLFTHEAGDGLISVPVQELLTRTDTAASVSGGQNRLQIWLPGEGGGATNRQVFLAMSGSSDSSVLRVAVNNVVVDPAPMRIWGTA